MKTFDFAKEELNKYLALMGLSADISLSVAPDAFDHERFSRYDPELDDAFAVRLLNGEVSIKATNERAVLLGVYHFLKSQGCRFMHPGKDGEFVPRPSSLKNINETVYAKYRHRGTTDGGCGGGIEGMLAYIDFLPKIMMNSYFIEMTDFIWDMRYYYTYQNNPYRTPRDVSREEYDEWYELLKDEIKKRGLLFHGAGHGWTNMLMDGITETKRITTIKLTNDATECKNPEILAMVNGKRALHMATPVNTNLCYSRDAVRKGLINKICEYSERHPEIDYLHIWLGDAYANLCECEECRKKSPTDWYVKLLNELDFELTSRKSKQKLVFLVYFELLYPPKEERIFNEDRFVLLFCPFGRDFTKRYSDWQELPYAPVELNKFDPPRDMHMGLYLAQLRDWKKVFSGDSLVFDYNLYDGAGVLDLTGLTQSKIVSDDCLFLKDIGLSGRIECGSTHLMTPTPIIYHAMASALFYGKSPDESAFLRDAFGSDKAAEFLKAINCLPIDCMLRRRDTLTDAEMSKIKRAKELICDFRKNAEALTPENEMQKGSLTRLLDYTELLEFVFDIAEKKPLGFDESTRTTLTENLRLLVYNLEEKYPLTFDATPLFEHIRAFIRGYKD
jgi:hypothetical protein